MDYHLYGSYDCSVNNPGKEGRDTTTITHTEASEEGSSALLRVSILLPITQISLPAILKAAEARNLPNEHYGTIKTTH
jgi:hypothetical protein